jgi:hypothetical protein
VLTCTVSYTATMQATLGMFNLVRHTSSWLLTPPSRAKYQHHLPRGMADPFSVAGTGQGTI